MATSNPSTPENGRPLGPHAIRRSFTLPTRIQQPSIGRPSTAQPPPDTAETLFAHRNARIVTFNTPSQPIRSSNLTDTATLSWSSVTERTLAAGPFRIYHVPGSVNFLNSGNFLHAILPKSQCWCVDGASTFVFRVGMNTYYRIELANDTDLDKAGIEELKLVFDKVLLYEKTACPFKKGSSDHLPQEPETPTPRGRVKPSGKARKWKLDRVWQPEDGETTRLSDLGSAEYSDSDASVATSTTSLDSHDVIVSAETAELVRAASPDPPEEEIKLKQRPKSLSAARSITAPPLLNLQSSSPPKLEPLKEKPCSQSSNLDTFDPAHTEPYNPEGTNEISKFEDPEQTPTAAPSSHSRDALEATVVDESQPLDKNGETGLDKGLPESELQEETIDPAFRNDSVAPHNPKEPAISAPKAEETSTSPTNQDETEIHPHLPHNSEISSPLDDDITTSAPSTPTLMSDTSSHPKSPTTTSATTTDEIITPPSTLRLRQPAKSRPRYRSISPSSTSTSSRNIQTSIILDAHSHQLPAVLSIPSTIIRKTYEILMSPPSHLVEIMLSIAARLAGKVGRLSLDYGLGDGDEGGDGARRRKRGSGVPGGWEESEEEGIDWEEEEEVEAE
ncbi:MAG: hypothetical protein M1820_004013 [Bogoriella megaspora]|nr:MAG: hypothetical protein M1820_004013 [Bogoriella megaspora]